jgi:curved DNA-binding protein CbpA
MDARREECLAILEVARDASRAEIVGAYRRLCKRYHPDRFAADPAKVTLANELLAAINAAYDYLTCP